MKIPQLTLSLAHPRGSENGGFASPFLLPLLISSGEKRFSNWNKILFRRGVEITGPGRPRTSLPRPRYFLVKATTSNASTHDACIHEAIPRLEIRISVSFGGFPLFWLASANFLPFSIPRATRVTQSSFFFPLSLLLLLLSRAWIREQEERRHCIRRRFPSQEWDYLLGSQFVSLRKKVLLKIIKICTILNSVKDCSTRSFDFLFFFSFCIIKI